MNQFDLGYVTALFEGEGYLHLEQRKDGSYTGLVAVNNLHKERVDKLQELFGGTVFVFKIERRPSTWQWQRNGKQALPFLETILPGVLAPFQQKEIVVYKKFYSTTDRAVRDRLLDWWRKRKAVERAECRGRMRTWLKAERGQ